MTEIQLEISITDTISKHNTDWNDTYRLLARPDSEIDVFYSFEKPDTGPREHFFTMESLSPSDVPERIGDVFNLYVDAESVGLPTSGNSAPEMELENTTLTVKDGDEEYKFNIYSRKYAQVSSEGKKLEISSVPYDIREAAESHIPDEITCF